MLTYVLVCIIFQAPRVRIHIHYKIIEPYIRYDILNTMVSQLQRSEASVYHFPILPLKQ